MSVYPPRGCSRRHVTSTAATTTTSSAQPEVTKVVQIFFVDEPGYNGLAHTLFHRDSGSVLGIEEDRTTYVITTTRTDLRPKPTGNATTTLTTSLATPSRKFGPPGGWGNGTGRPSTITQGPATFLYTGTRSGPGRTVINRCSLNGTVSAACNMTHVGDVWYTNNPTWNGTYSTYSYNWTSGDRFGYAPVTITQGAELLDGPAAPTASGFPNAASILSVNGLLYGVLLWVGVAVGVYGLGW
ncbi:hypothetical protein V8F20_003736 [Naviculisporaceae sp. PSN 640]